MKNVYKPQSNTVQYYEWKEIERYLCSYIGIEKEYFRDYHKVVGGKYKDFWHVWLAYVNDNVYNNTLTLVWINNDSYMYKRIEEKFGKWAFVLIDAMTDLFDLFEDDYFFIYYEW